LVIGFRRRSEQAGIIDAQIALDEEVQRDLVDHERPFFAIELAFLLGQLASATASSSVMRTKS
jgi:hypothetical protein